MPSGGGDGGFEKKRPGGRAGRADRSQAKSC